MLTGKRILLIISGGIAAYKALELIRLLRRNGASVRCILTKGGAEFITPLSVASLSEQPVYTDLFSLKDETEMGHIRLSREADLVVVAPASANMMSKMVHGAADDLASTTILATDKPVMVCPAMNPMMWTNQATQDNISVLRQRGITIVGPDSGDMACGEIGEGRLMEAADIVKRIEDHFGAGKPLAGKTALVTAGPTYEPIDPVRFIGNRSSGKQGFAIAKALADAGAAVTLITGPVALADPESVKTIRIGSAIEMAENCALYLKVQTQVDIAVGAAAVSDWRPAKQHVSKMKKRRNAEVPNLELVENPDVIAGLGGAKKGRPTLVIGFAAETENLIENAKEKLTRKNCDWIVANNVGDEPVFGADENHVFLVTRESVEEWPRAGKDDIARQLVDRIATHFAKPSLKEAAE
jgi:phosphopantothenoylcysteine decarboxylase/phosphopantothenate--cysteine ligase